MVKIDVIEGTAEEAEDVLWYHYDVANDVLYLRLAALRDTATYAEETPHGFLLLRCQEDDRPAGLTVVNWWRRFGHGDLPDSMRAIEQTILPLAHLAALTAA